MDENERKQEDREAYLKKLGKIICQEFKEDELKKLCKKLALDFEKDLDGEDCKAKCFELPKRYERRDDLPTLIDAAKKMKPNLNWDETSFVWYFIVTSADVKIREEVFYVSDLEMAETSFYERADFVIVDIDNLNQGWIWYLFNKSLENFVFFSKNNLQCKGMVSMDGSFVLDLLNAGHINNLVTYCPDENDLTKFFKFTMLMRKKLNISGPMSARGTLGS